MFIISKAKYLIMSQIHEYQFYNLFIDNLSLK